MTPLARVDHAEPVALGIRQDHIVGVGRPFGPVDLGGAQGQQTLDLAHLVVGVQVEWIRGGTCTVERTRSRETFGPMPYRGRRSLKSSLSSSRGSRSSAADQKGPGAPGHRPG